MKERVIFANNRDGWGLELHQYWDPETHDPGKRPVVMLPGYCMNTFILNFHPNGDSMVRYLARGGFEVWTANLRGQGDSRRYAGKRKFGFRELCLVDIPVVLDTVLNRGHSERDDVSVIGCSLGATFAFGYLAHHLDNNPVGAVVSLGGPLRWEKAHPLLEVAFASAQIAGMIRFRGTRQLARFALPIAQKVPSVLAIYMNTEHIDLEVADELVKTVDDPVPHLNRQIAHWITTRDLYVAGVNVTRAMKHIHVPLLCVAANRDGIVPPETAVSAMNAFGTDDVEVLRVGDRDNWFAHADLFVNDEAAERVFEPLRMWLTTHD
jgi:poly(3-hydroxyalkanoate) synthetase